MAYNTQLTKSFLLRKIKNKAQIKFSNLERLISLWGRFPGEGYLSEEYFQWGYFPGVYFQRGVYFGGRVFCEGVIFSGVYSLGEVFSTGVFSSGRGVIIPGGNIVGGLTLRLGYTPPN